MIEQAPPLSQEQIEHWDKTRIQVPVKAEYMAYAQKPHEEDALILSAMHKRAEHDQHREREITEDIHEHNTLYAQLVDKQVALGHAIDESRWAADSAAEKAGRDYDASATTSSHDAE